MPRRPLRFISILVATSALALATMAVVGLAAGGAAGKTTFHSTTTVSIAAQATLTQPGNPLGKGLSVTVNYSCFPGSGGKGGYPGGGGFASVSVTDLIGSQGFGGFAPKCDDTKQTAVVFVPGGFAAGAGAANAFVCGFDCNGTSREIKIS